MGLNLIHENLDVHQHGKADDPDIGEVDHQHHLADDDIGLISIIHLVSPKHEV